MAEEPLDGLAVGAVTEFSGELEDPGGAESRHADAPSAAVDLGVAVLGGGNGFLRDQMGGGGDRKSGVLGRDLNLRRVLWVEVVVEDHFGAHFDESDFRVFFSIKRRRERRVN